MNGLTGTSGLKGAGGLQPDSEAAPPNTALTSRTHSIKN